MLSAVLERVELETALRSALERDELEIHHQPLLDLDSGRPVAVEALLRWTHPVLGAVPPSTFVPIAEETGAILPIGRWVLGAACGRVAALREHLPDLALSVNVSAHQLREERFAHEVRAALERSGLPGAALTLELTETVLIEEHGDALRQLLRVKELGVSIAVDGFGTGYSALRYLQQLPVDVLKIDRSFVDLLGDDGNDDAVVRTIIELGRVMRLDTIAEGIETSGQLRRLHGLGCRVGQGFHFARPMPGDALAGYFAQAA
jgi:EAL domain-containing protein (putative c-di-GMP-specific phosphodiesterase class I)